MPKDSYNSAGGGAATLSPPKVHRPAASPSPRVSKPSRVTAISPPAPSRAPRLPRGVRFGVWLNRPRRVLLALTGVWIVAIFDLGFTLYEADTANFVELNPIAAGLLNSSPALLYAFKFCLLGVGTLILLLIRKQPLAELACWLMLTTMVYVGVRWLRYYDCVLGSYVDPHLAPPW